MGGEPALVKHNVVSIWLSVEVKLTASHPPVAGLALGAVPYGGR